MASFGDRLGEAFSRYGQLCVGVDPHSWLLSEWGLPDSAVGARELALRTVDAASGVAGIIKPQIAFFERFGAAGYTVLEEVIGTARAQGLVVIADVKRGDVGSTVEAYAHAWLASGAPLESDAMTVSAYQGFGSLASAAALARTQGKGLFVLAATSNPEAAALQQARTARGEAVARTISREVSEWNQTFSPGPLGAIGLVVGATISMADFGLDADAVGTSPLLAPGFGAQGAAIADLRELYGAASRQVLVAASRSILSAGPGGIAEAVRDAQAEVLSCRA